MPVVIGSRDVEASVLYCMYICIYVWCRTVPTFEGCMPVHVLLYSRRSLPHDDVDMSIRLI
jgi:hypothetical protein